MRSSRRRRTGDSRDDSEELLATVEDEKSLTREWADELILGWTRTATADVREAKRRRAIQDGDRIETRQDRRRQTGGRNHRISSTGEGMDAPPASSRWHRLHCI